MSGTIDRSWNSRIENARSPNGVRSRPTDCSIGSTCAVDDSASGSPSANAAGIEKCVPIQTTPVIAKPHTTTWMSPSPKISCFNRHSRVGLSSSPTMNNNSVIPSSAIPIFASASPTSPRTCGPTTAPATRYPSVAPSPRRRNSSTNTSPTPSSTNPSRNSNVAPPSLIPPPATATGRAPAPPPRPLPRMPAGSTHGARSPPARA